MNSAINEPSRMKRGSDSRTSTFLRKLSTLYIYSLSDSVVFDGVFDESMKSVIHAVSDWC